MFDEVSKQYKERLRRFKQSFEALGDDTAQLFVAHAKEETTKQKLVKTGNYRRSWAAEVKKAGLETTVKCLNEAEYASHLEYGHRIVTRSGIDTGRKTIGRFVGRTAIQNTRRFIAGTVKKLLRKILYEKST